MMNDMKSRASRKVAVLGPIPRDQIVTHAGERFEKYGCVLYTAVALSALLDCWRHDRPDITRPPAGRGPDQGDPRVLPEYRHLRYNVAGRPG